MRGNEHTFSRSNIGELVVTDAATARQLWAAFPGGRRVLSYAVSGRRCVVLLELDLSVKHDENLLCVDDAGTIVWRAVLPDASGPDCYVSMELDRSSVIANSWSGYRVVLEVETGVVLESVFVK